MRFLTLLLLALLATPLTAQDAGMDFVEKPFEELLAQAKEENKIIFIDAYTTWCGPCKMMAKKVFPQSEVGTVYNERFINAKFDMEKGEGPGLAQRYSVMAYPTYLFINAAGEIVHKGLGYIPAEEFLALADVATGDSNLGAMNARYDGGDRDATFVKEYVGLLSDMYEQERAGTVVEAYLATQDDWSSDEAMQMILDNPGEVGGKRMNYIMGHADKAMEMQGSGAFMMGMQRTLLTKYMREAGKRQLPPTAEVVPFYAKNAAPLKDRLVAHYTMFQAEQMRDTEAYLPAAKAYFSAYPSNDAQELNGAAWTFFESAEAPDDLKVALGWAQRSVEMEAGYANMDTLAWLYKKTGNTKMAKETAMRAIELAKETDQDYSSTEEILND